MRERVKVIMEILADAFYELPISELDNKIVSSLEDVAKEIDKVSSTGNIEAKDLVPGMVIEIPSDWIKHPGEYTFKGFAPGTSKGWKRLMIDDIFGNEYESVMRDRSVVKLLKYKE